MFYLSSELHTPLPEPVPLLPTPIPSFAPIRSPTGESALIRPDEIVGVRVTSKMPEFYKKSPLSKAEKHSDFQVTL